MALSSHRCRSSCPSSCLHAHSILHHCAFRLAMRLQPKRSQSHTSHRVASMHMLKSKVYEVSMRCARYDGEEGLACLFFFFFLAFACRCVTPLTFSCVSFSSAPPVPLSSCVVYRVGHFLPLPPSVPLSSVMSSDASSPKRVEDHTAFDLGDYTWKEMHEDMERDHFAGTFGGHTHTHTHSRKNSGRRRSTTGGTGKAATEGER